MLWHILTWPLRALDAHLQNTCDLLSGWLMRRGISKKMQHRAINGGMCVFQAALTVEHAVQWHVLAAILHGLCAVFFVSVYWVLYYARHLMDPTTTTDAHRARNNKRVSLIWLGWYLPDCFVAISPIDVLGVAVGLTFLARGYLMKTPPQKPPRRRDKVPDALPDFA